MRACPAATARQNLVLPYQHMDEPNVRRSIVRQYSISKEVLEKAVALGINGPDPEDEAEVADFLDGHGELKTGDGRQRVVRHGHLPEREVLTGIGPVALRQPRVRDRAAAADDPGRIRFSSTILPPYMRRSKSIETLLPILYLKGISTGDFSEALAALLGKDVPGLSASAISRLKEGWHYDYAAWAKRDLSAKRYVYIWADGIHLQVRLEDQAQCILVIIGATP